MQRRRGTRDDMIAQATVDCSNDTEMATALLLAIHENLALPFRTQILRLMANVIAVDVNEADELIAFCERNGKRQRIPLVDFRLPVPRRPAPSGSRRIDVGRRVVANHCSHPPARYAFIFTPKNLSLQQNRRPS